MFSYLDEIILQCLQYFGDENENVVTAAMLNDMTYCRRLMLFLIMYCDIKCSGHIIYNSNGCKTI